MYRSQIEAYFQENQELILSHIQRLVRIPSVAKPELAAPGAASSGFATLGIRTRRWMWERIKS